MLQRDALAELTWGVQTEEVLLRHLDPTTLAISLPGDSDGLPYLEDGASTFCRRRSRNHLWSLHQFQMLRLAKFPSPAASEDVLPVDLYDRFGEWLTSYVPPVCVVGNWSLVAFWLAPILKQYSSFSHGAA
jgi:hypothetical protein